jgi:DNA topoisomerase-1
VERRSRRGKVFFGCSNYPTCDFTLWSRPVAEECPNCHAPFLVEKVTKRNGRQLACQNEGCGFVRSDEGAPA